MMDIVMRMKGFTLIELVVVIGVIGILSAALIFIINPVTQIQKGRDTTRKADLNNIRTALELYRQAEGNYPSTLPDCGDDLEGEESDITFMRDFPCDPQSDAPYTYTADPQGVVYTISACLEHEADPDIEEEAVGGCNTAIVQSNP